MFGLARSRGSVIWISVLLALAANTAVSIHNIVELIGNDVVVDHSRQKLAQLNLLLSDLKDAEAGAGGKEAAWKQYAQALLSSGESYYIN